MGLGAIVQRSAHSKRKSSTVTRLSVFVKVISLEIKLTEGSLREKYRKIPQSLFEGWESGSELPPIEKINISPTYMTSPRRIPKSYGTIKTVRTSPDLAAFLSLQQSKIDEGSRN